MRIQILLAPWGSLTYNGWSSADLVEYVLILLSNVFPGEPSSPILFPISPKLTACLSIIGEVDPSFSKRFRINPGIAFMIDQRGSDHAGPGPFCNFVSIADLSGKKRGACRGCLKEHQRGIFDM